MNDQEACELLAGGNAVNGLEYLPIERIKSRITDEFSQDWQKLDQVTWEHNSAGFNCTRPVRWFAYIVAA